MPLTTAAQTNQTVSDMASSIADKLSIEFGIVCMTVVNNAAKNQKGYAFWTNTNKPATSGRVLLAVLAVMKLFIMFAISQIQLKLKCCTKGDKESAADQLEEWLKQGKIFFHRSKNF